ncbi:MAG: peptidase M4, partial [Methanobacterium sp.]|nr:peptidase M4 [Methanobacterium sp.]
LVEIDGQMVYVVPVLMDGDVVGQIEIDAYTGENVGGAGGVT